MEKHMNHNLKLLKEAIQKKLSICNWNPSEKILKRIANRIKLLNREPSQLELSEIIRTEYGSYKTYVLEGIDNSDLITLLRLANNVDETNDK